MRETFPKRREAAMSKINKTITAKRCLVIGSQHCCAGPGRMCDNFLFPGGDRQSQRAARRPSGRDQRAEITAESRLRSRTASGARSDRISDADVRDSLAAGPTPRIVLVDGGVAGVYLMMELFGKFLSAWAIRVPDPRSARRRVVADPYGSSERLAASWRGITNRTACARC